MKVTLFQGIVYGVFILAAVIGVIVFATYSGNGGKQNLIGTVVVWGSLPKEEFDMALSAARESNQDMKGVSYIEKDQATLTSELVAAIAEGKSPDLVLIPHENLLPLVKFINPIPATDLSVRNFKDVFATGGEVFLTPDGSGSYGVPFLIDPLVLFENRRILSSAGIAVPPTTWEELTGLVPRVVIKSGTGNIVRALIALGTYANIHNARAILSTLFLQAGVPISTFSAQGLRRADFGLSQQAGSIGQAVVRFYTQFADSAKVSHTWNAALPDSRAQFLSGDLALYLGFASEASFLRASNPNLDFDVAPAPQLQTSTAKSTYGVVYGFVRPRGSANPSGAYQAAAELTGLAPNQAAAIATHMAPVDRTLLNTRPSASDAAVTYASALYAEAWLSPSPPATDNVFSTMITNVTSGRLQIDSALTYAENTLTTLLQQ